MEILYRRYTQFEHAPKAGVLMKQSATHVEQGGDEEMRTRCFKAPNCKGQTAVAFDAREGIQFVFRCTRMQFQKIIVCSG